MDEIKNLLDNAEKQCYNLGIEAMDVVSRSNEELSQYSSGVAIIYAYQNNGMATVMCQVTDLEFFELVGSIIAQAHKYGNIKEMSLNKIMTKLYAMTERIEKTETEVVFDEPRDVQ